MAVIDTRGYVSKFERKTASSGTTYTKFLLAIQQKRKDKSGQMVTEKLYLNCCDFSGKDPPGLYEGEYGLTAYVGIKGYLTVSGWCKDGKGGANLDVTVKEYEEGLEQKGGKAPAKAPTASPPADPFALEGQ